MRRDEEKKLRLPSGEKQREDTVAVRRSLPIQCSLQRPCYTVKVFILYEIATVIK